MKKPNAVIFFLFFATSFFLFFYKLPRMAPFDADQEFFAYQYMRIFKEHRPTLLGIETSAGRLFVGPLYTYLAAFAIWLTGGHPIGQHIMTLFILSFQASLTYWFFTKLKGRKTGFIAALFILFSSAIWHKAFIPTPVNFLYLMGLFFFYCFTQIHKNYSYFIWISILLGLALHLHFTLFFFYPIFFILILWQKPKYLTFRHLILSILIILFFASPLILFDLRHQFLLTKNLLSFLIKHNTNGLSVVANASKVAKVGLSVFSSVLYPRPNQLLDVFVLISFVFILIKSGKEFIFQIIALIFLLSFTFFTFYHGHIPDYYLYYLLSLFFFAVSDLVVSVSRVQMLKFAITVLFAFLVLANIRVIRQSGGPYPLFVKMQAITYIKRQSQGKTVKVYLDTDLGLQFGFNYLLDYYGVKRDDKNYDQIYQIRLRQNDPIPGVEFKERGMDIGIKVRRLD